MPLGKITTQASNRGPTPEMIKIMEERKAGIKNTDALNVDSITEDAVNSILPNLDEIHEESILESDMDPVSIAGGVNVPEGRELAASIGRAQSELAPEILRRSPSTAFDNPNLSKEEENALLETFAAQEGVHKNDVAVNPALYEKFGRYLGAQTDTLDQNKYFEYTSEGKTGSGRKVPTPWLSPKFVQENTGVSVLQTPEGGYLQTRDFGPSISRNMQDFSNRASDEVNKTLNDSFNPLNIQSQQDLSRRIEESTGINPQSIDEFMYTLINNYAAVREGNIDASKFWSDVFLHSVLSHTRKNMWRQREASTRTELDKAKDPDLSEDVMSGLADDNAIGRMVLSSMGFESPSKDHIQMAGSLARNIVMYTFQEDDPTGGMVDTNIGERPTGFEHRALFRTVKVPGVNKSGQKVFNLLTTLTREGELVAEKLEPLTNKIIPSSARTVRFTERETTTRDAKVRKTRGLKDVEQGDVENQRINLEIMNNTPHGIHGAGLNMILGILSNPDASAVLDHQGFINISGNGFGDKGSFGKRFNLTVDRDDYGKVINNQDGTVKYKNNSGDRNKDLIFKDTIKWATDNRDTEMFFYDYFYGNNNRMMVDQTQGNYQSNKLARSLIEAGIKENYDLSNPRHVMLMKAGIMKRFGHDKKSIENSANLFDGSIKTFRDMVRDIAGAGGVELAKLAESEEGFASLSAVAEAISFDAAITAHKNGGTSTYKSGFYAEIDGLTNGMAHSSMQAGDIDTARSTNIFSKNEFDRAVEKGEVEGLDVYDRTFTTMIEHARSSGDKSIISFLNVLDSGDSKLGRAFAKAPVMIFGYGAGNAMIDLSVKAYMKDLFTEKPGLLNTIIKDIGEFGVEKAIDTLSESMNAALMSDFSMIKELSDTLQSIGNDASIQGFSLSVPLINGGRSNFGRIEFDVDYESRHRYHIGGTKAGIGKDGSPYVRKSVEISTYKTTREMNPLSYIDKVNYKGDLKRSYKAATQAVILNHANDNINMTNAIRNLHNKGLRNTSGHIFDGLLVVPLRAEEAAKELNNVFMRINKHPKSHLKSMLKSLHFELDPAGNVIEDPNTKLPEGRVGKERFLRRLLPEGMAMAEDLSISTWDKRLDRYAYHMNPELNIAVSTLNIRRDNSIKVLHGALQFFF